MNPARESIVGRLRVRRRRPSATTRGGSHRCWAASTPARRPGAGRHPVCATPCGSAPGRVRVDGLDPRPPPDWSNALSGALDGLLRGAARPADGAVPVNADAVMFRDRAELLACLAEDTVRPGNRANWWWRLLADASGVAARWLGEPALVPAVADLLDRRGSLAEVVRSFQPAEATMVLAAVCRTFGLRALADVVTRPRLLALPADMPDVHHELNTGPHRSPASQPPAPPVAPWPQVGSALARLGPERGSLVGITLAISRTPALVRAPLFLSATDAWLAGSSNPHVPSGVLLAGRDTPFAQRASGRDERGPLATRQRGQFVAHPPSLSRAVPHRGSTDEPTARPEPLRVAPYHARSVPGSRTAGQPVRERRRASDRQPEVARDVANSIEPTQTAGRGDVVSTELGGIFYLLDLALHLGLYGDFTEPERPGLELDPWDLLCLLAAALGAARGAADDPVWPLLARLAGRDPRSRPGASFVTPAGWQIPVDWVRPFASTPVAARSWRWSAARSRLLIDHPAGFPVVDIPVDGDVTRRMARASIHRYGPGIPTPARPRYRRAPPAHGPSSGRPLDRPGGGIRPGPARARARAR